MGLSGSPANVPKSSKFASRNLNAVTRAPPSREPRYGAGGGRLLVLGKPQQTAQTAKAQVVAPTPLNTPSLRRENRGQDLSIKLVPSGGGGWATTSAEKALPQPSSSDFPPASATVEATEEKRRTLAPQGAGGAAVAPWARQQVAPAPVPSDESVPDDDHRWRRDAYHPPQRRLEEDLPPDAKEELEESQTEYMRRLARQRSEQRRKEEEAEMAAQRARAAERLAMLEARKAHDEKAREDKLPVERWQRGLRVASSPTAKPPEYSRFVVTRTPAAPVAAADAPPPTPPPLRQDDVASRTSFVGRLSAPPQLPPPEASPKQFVDNPTPAEAAQRPHAVVPSVVGPLKATPPLDPILVAPKAPVQAASSLAPVQAASSGAPVLAASGAPVLAAPAPPVRVSAAEAPLQAVPPKPIQASPVHAVPAPPVAPVAPAKSTVVAPVKLAPPGAHLKAPPPIPIEEQPAAAPPIKPLSVSADEYTRHTVDDAATKLYDPKTGAMVDAKQQPSSKSLRIIADDRKAEDVTKQAQAAKRQPPVEESRNEAPPPPSRVVAPPPVVLLRPPVQVHAKPISHKEERKTDENTPANNNNQHTASHMKKNGASEHQQQQQQPQLPNGALKTEEDCQRAKRAKRRAERLARGPRTRGLLFKYDTDGQVVCVDAPESNEKQTRKGRRAKTKPTKRDEPAVAKRETQQRPSPADREVVKSELGPVGPKPVPEPVGGRAPARPARRPSHDGQALTLGGAFGDHLQSALAPGKNWNADFPSFDQKSPNPMSWGLDPISHLGSSSGDAQPPLSGMFGSALIQQADAAIDEKQAKAASGLLWSSS